MESYLSDEGDISFSRPADDDIPSRRLPLEEDHDRLIYSGSHDSAGANGALVPSPSNSKACCLSKIQEHLMSHGGDRMNIEELQALSQLPETVVNMLYRLTKQVR